MASNSSDWIILGETLQFSAKLQKSNNEVVSLFPDKNKGEEEYLMTLNAEIANSKIPWLQEIKDENVEFLVVLDKSGSMAGKPWRQVQNAAAKMDKLVQNNAKVKTTKLKLS